MITPIVAYCSGFVTATFIAWVYMNDKIIRLKKTTFIEKEEQLKADYERYNQLLEKAAPRKKDTRGVSTTMMMAERLFSDDEGSSDEDLF